MSRLASLFVGSESATGDEQNAGPGYRILFVDDEPNVLKAMRRIFRQENYTVLTAGSGQEALHLLRQEPVQVVISDHRMPAMTGAELLREIKALYPATIRIMLTGYADINAVMGAVNDGAVYKFITKPWNDDDLRLTVSLALEQYDLRQENRQLKKQSAVQKKEITRLCRFASAQRSQIGRILVKRRMIAQGELEKALAVQKKSHEILPKILVDTGTVDEAAVMEAMISELGVDRVSPSEFSVTAELAALIPREICEKSVLVPLKQSDGRLVVAMADPSDYMKIDDLKFVVGAPVKAVLATEKEIRAKLGEIYAGADSLESALSEIDLTDPTETIEIVLDEEDEDIEIQDLLDAQGQPPAVRIVNAIISDALRHKASDIHIEPKTKYTMVRYRIDDLLQDKIHFPTALHLPIVSRIKVMSELDIAERRKPQDGRVTVKTSTRIVDMRISTLPTINGEKVVLRVLDKNAAIRDIEDLGISPKDLTKISRFIEQPQGIVLATGPTGSGKTTTLYSLLRKGAKITKNFTTIEDPVEYQMGMAEQVNIREKIGLTFVNVLRSILRQDPNVIMLGEIRDHETAEVAFHAALTGHLVLSTLHTNNAIASITRLRDMGMRSYVIADALIGIIAQRLIRRVCPECAKEEAPTAETLKAIRMEGVAASPKRGQGCTHCAQSGYKGRMGIYEVFHVDDEIKRMIHREATETELFRAARLTGMTSLLDDAKAKVLGGQASCEEVLRVLGPQNHLEITCHNCGAHLEERYAFCPFCGESNALRCKSCGYFLDIQWKACPSCGTAAREATAPRPVSAGDNPESWS